MDISTVYFDVDPLPDVPLRRRHICRQRGLELDLRIHGEVTEESCVNGADLP